MEASAGNGATEMAVTKDLDSAEELCVEWFATSTGGLAPEGQGAIESSFP